VSGMSREAEESSLGKKGTKSATIHPRERKMLKKKGGGADEFYGRRKKSTGVVGKAQKERITIFYRAGEGKEKKSTTALYLSGTDGLTE